eukprot:4144720-Alexandrium_andersonii.AAC.1
MPDLRLLLSIITCSAAASACSEGSSGMASALFGGLPSLRLAPNIVRSTCGQCAWAQCARAQCARAQCACAQRAHAQCACAQCACAQCA